MARAVYSSIPFIVLDDVLSAVDSGVAAHLVEHCLAGLLVQGRTVIMATHAVRFLGHRCISKVVVLSSEGTIAAQSTFEELAGAGALPEGCELDVPSPKGGQTG